MSDDGLVAFLRARYDELEAAAKAAERYWDGISVESATSAESAHIARHDPDRVLRRVEAGRALLDMWEDAARRRYNLPEGVSEGRDPDERLRDDAVAEAMDEVVAALATEFSDHPDYQEDWKP